MISAGNDIVALKAVDQQRTQQHTFYSKFITPTEFALYNPDETTLVNFVWLLWSAKESAYKYLKRRNADLIFSPAKLIIQNISITDTTTNLLNADEPIDVYYQGEVKADDVILLFKSAIGQTFIASTINNGDMLWAVKQIDTADYETQSQAVRQFLIDDLSERFNLKGLTIKIHAAGYPVLIKKGKELAIAVSFAHHDRYISYSCQIPK